MRNSKIIQLLFSLATTYVVNAQSFCSSAQHSGQSVKETSNKVGNIGGVGYELWADSGNNSATFYSDGSFSCTFQSAKDYLCRSGLSFDSTQTHDQIGHIYADFKLVKQNINNVDYSYVGIYGWTRNPLVEFYVVDNWLSQYRPGDWVGNKKHGDFTIDGAQYTVYENTRYGPSIDGDTQFKQYFSIRQQARDCGTIDITAHFQQWEKLGMTLGKMHEAKVLGEAGSNGAGTSGTADFPYAKVYIGKGNGGGGGNAGNAGNNSNNSQGGGQAATQEPSNNNTGGNNNNNNNNNTPNKSSCSANILKQGYKCCPDNCVVTYVDADGDWSIDGQEWCGCGNRNTYSKAGDCPKKILDQGYKCCSDNCIIYYNDEDGDWGVENGEWCGCGGGNNNSGNTGNTGGNAGGNAGGNTGNAGGNTDFCSSAQHSGQSVKETSNKVGNIGGVGYELWADSGNNSATFYSDGSFSCTFQNAKDYLCRSGLSFDSTQTHDQIGHIYADFKLVKQNINNVDYSYVGIYGWTRNPLVEFYVVDNWLSQYRPGDWVGNKKHGDFTIDGAQYTVYENTRYGPSIDGDTQFKQYFSIRQQARDCGTIDITAHFQQWEKLGMTLGKMHEAKVLGEAGSNGSGTSGTADFPYAKVYI
ncbi:concanavalin A-like lectin/glucanase, partial [Anaeromyces robustus]